MYYSLYKQNSKTNRDFYKIPGIKTIDNIDEKVLKNLPPDIKEDFSFFRPHVIRVNAGNLWGEVKFKGKVYLLVDEKTGSSADNFAAFAKDTGFATLVGGVTNGTRANVHIPVANLPISGFIINYSRELVLNADGTINMEMKTTPHILVDDPTYNEDFNKDKCIQAIIEDKI
ncbi:S41 family peptidase [Lutispora sp.]|uniref:S41 family peptidase n=1 Tax=Lutispora sp. TaxID=2828727 RepID=UPI002B1FF499|nr:S41 family peptidase [Lutispora sp.]MEA4963476.1 S41 family peptidase [Lutispora sp.]